jgi:hypothetical protein
MEVDEGCDLLNGISLPLSQALLKFGVMLRHDAAQCVYRREYEAAPLRQRTKADGVAGTWSAHPTAALDGVFHAPIGGRGRPRFSRKVLPA